MEHRRPFRFTRANPLGAFRVLCKHSTVLWLAVSVLLYRLSHHALPSTWTYFVIEKFAWTEREVGYSLGVVGILFVLVSGYFTRLAVPRFGPIKIGYIGLLGISGSFIGYAIAPTTWLLYIFLITGGLQGFVSPVINGLMSKRLPANMQGELQGSMASISSLTSIVSPPLMTWVFRDFSDQYGVYFPGAPFIAAALCSISAFVIFAAVTRRSSTVSSEMSKRMASRMA